MKIAFCVFKYFPYGGMQRDFLKILLAVKSLGAHVEVFTMQWQGAKPAGITVHEITTKGITNHARYESFITNVRAKIDTLCFDFVMGFNKMPGLDGYYAADQSYLAKYTKRRLKFKSPRAKHFLNAEKAIFAPSAKTHIFTLATAVKKQYQGLYHTDDKRFTELPPGVDASRVLTEKTQQIKNNAMKTLNLDSNKKHLLFIGSGFRTKGLMRALLGLKDVIKKMPVHLWVIGQDKKAPFVSMAKKMNIFSHVTFLGGQDNIPIWLTACDVLVHPAFAENTGTVLLEAVVSALPVITTSVCGYAHYIKKAKMGVVLPEPFSQVQFNQALIDLLSQDALSVYCNNAQQFCKTADIFALPEVAAEKIMMLTKGYADAA